jgi:hypothetical protein
MELDSKLEISHRPKKNMFESPRKNGESSSSLEKYMSDDMRTELSEFKQR